MSLLLAVVVLIAVGVLLWAADRYLLMNGTIKGILFFIVILAVVLWLLNGFGVLHMNTRF